MMFLVMEAIVLLVTHAVLKAVMHHAVLNLMQCAVEMVRLAVPLVTSALEAVTVKWLPRMKSFKRYQYLLQRSFTMHMSRIFLAVMDIIVLMVKHVALTVAVLHLMLCAVEMAIAVIMVTSAMVITALGERLPISKFLKCCQPLLERRRSFTM